ncbi:MAG: hypothetical protein HON43_04185 [Alphaproteobacteria bacterium]|jgi:hypothetical protein|nr:hypothetical protein [Alphaproteobacteria bacterium]MBT5389878.1 hypothetical protein [Alphaproteobacteria bacterium]MBT5540842.1 hypothetical protein [Alphaproteobacteria bacterium]
MNILFRTTLSAVLVCVMFGAFELRASTDGECLRDVGQVDDKRHVNIYKPFMQKMGEALDKSERKLWTAKRLINIATLESIQTVGEIDTKMMYLASDEKEVTN